jgi:predicted Rossmann fold flavoprotein
MERFDCVIVGAGAAGLHAAGLAGQRGLRVLLLDHAEQVAEKIRISGGGRCNFTNRDVQPGHFLSDNPDFCRSALARYPSAEFIALVQRHRIPFHEKHKGQLFCDDSSDDIISMLLRECEAGGVRRRQPCAVQAVRRNDRGFELDTTAGTVAALQLVVATGGLSIPKIGATDFGYRLARQFGHRVVEPRPALVPLSFDAAQWAPFAALAGVSLPVRIGTGAGRQAGEFHEDLLFTHRGLSGPAVLQISSFWRAGQALRIDLHPAQPLAPSCRSAWRRPGSTAWACPPPSPPLRCATANWPRWPPACTSGISPPAAPKAGKKPKSRPAAWTPATSARKAWAAGSYRGCISSARWWT